MKEMYSYYNENENLRNQRYTYASFSGNELFDGSTSKAAARYNHLEVITWLLSKTRFDYAILIFCIFFSVNYCISSNLIMNKRYSFTYY